MDQIRISWSAKSLPDLDYWKTLETWVKFRSHTLLKLAMLENIQACSLFHLKSWVSIHNSALKNICQTFLLAQIFFVESRNLLAISRWNRCDLVSKLSLFFPCLFLHQICFSYGAMSIGRRLAVWAINWSTLKFLELYIRNPEECIRITKIMFPFLELIVNTDKMKRGTYNLCD